LVCPKTVCLPLSYTYHGHNLAFCTGWPCACPRGRPQGYTHTTPILKCQFMTDGSIELALQMVDRVYKNGLPFCAIDCDSLYGRAGWLRDALGQKGHEYYADMLSIAVQKSLFQVIALS
jgi:hypothetical protein